MNKVTIIFLIFTCNLFGQNEISLNLHSDQQQKSKLIVAINERSNELQITAKLIQQMLSCHQWKTCGFDVRIELIPDDPKKIAKYFKTWLKEKNLFALIINENTEHIEWRLFDLQTKAAITAKKFKKNSERLNAEHIADAVWHTLLGQEGFFSTRLAICKEIKLPSGKSCKDIYTGYPYAEITADSCKRIVSNSSVFALHWNEKIDNPLLFYSEATDRNVRLMSIDNERKRKIVSNFDGMNLFPSVSSDGQKVVYCVSQEGKTQLCLYERNMSTGKKSFKQLTTVGNNITPTILENGDIIFCSDGKDKPSICYYSAESESIDFITKDSYCASPTYNSKIKKIAYSKKCDGIMQIWVYDLNTKSHHQITIDPGHKEHCSWSPCGNYLLFAYDDGKKSRIAMQNLITHERIFLTNANESWSYPAWSPQYSGRHI